MRSDKFNLKKELEIDHNVDNDVGHYVDHESCPIHDARFNPMLAKRKFEAMIQNRILAESPFIQFLAAIHEGDLSKVKTCIDAGLKVKTEDFNALRYVVGKYGRPD